MTYEFDLHESKEEGRAEGKIEGKIEGKAEAKLEMVDGMLANDIPIETIIAISGFSREDILKRRDALTKK